VVNNLLLSVILGLVFVGTLYPLVTQALGHEISVGPPYFNAVAGPIALALVAFMALGPLLRWRRDRGAELPSRIALPLLVSAASLLLLVIFAPGIRLLPLLGLTFAPGIAAASLAPLWGRNLRRTPLFIYGMVIAHLGIALSLAGMASESAFTQETLVAARPGQTVAVGPYTVRFDSVEPVAGPNWTAIEARLTARRGNGTPFALRPQARLFSSPPTPTSEADIATRLDGQLYTVLGEGDEQGRWQLRLWWKPAVTLIWFGGMLVALGGLLALLGRQRRERRAARLEKAMA
jgi:cytochrome c-type biogenesis protein CcmF